MKSLEVGYWVDEEPYELSDAFPAAQVKISDCWLAVLADSVPPFPENSWPIYARYHNFWHLDKVVKVICCVCECEASREKFKDELRNCFGIKNNWDDILADFGQPLSEFWTNAKKNLVNIRHIHPS